MRLKARRGGASSAPFLPSFSFLALSGVQGQSDCGFPTGPEGLSVDALIPVLGGPRLRAPAETTGYTVDSVAYAPPLAFGTGEVQSTATNGYTGIIALPFGFSFFDTDFFQLKVSRKGFLTFNTGLGGGYNYPNQPLGSNSLPPNSIMAPYAYIGNSGGTIRTATLGEAPCRQFVISWEYLPQTGCSSNELLSQVVLHETSNAVEMHIGQFTSCLQITACVGIKGAVEKGVGPAAYETGEFALVDQAFRYAPTGATQTELVYLVDGEIVGQGDSVSVCISETTELVIAPTSPKSCRRLRPVVVMRFPRMRATRALCTTSISAPPRRAPSAFPFDGDLLRVGHHEQLDTRRGQLAWRYGFPDLCARGPAATLTGSTST